MKIAFENGKNSEDRILTMSGVIQKNDSDKLQKILTERNKNKHLLCTLESPGGDIPEAIKMVNLLNNFYTSIVAQGYIDSAAIFVLLAGNQRFCKKGTTFYFHKADFSSFRLSQSLQAYRNIIKYITSRTRLSTEKLIFLMKNKITLSDVEALEYGVIEKII